MKLIRFIAVVLIAVLLTGACAFADVVTTGNVNLRKGPGIAYRILDTIPKGTHVQYLGEKTGRDGAANWYNVEYQGLQGWISAKYAVYEPDEDPVVIIPGGDVVHEMKAMEVSPFWQQGLQTSAQYIGLNGYQETLSNTPKKYFDAYLTIAGSDKVDLMALYGGAYTIFGVSIGMDVSKAAVVLDNAGLVFRGVEGDTVRFTHTTAAGCNSNMVLKVVNSAVVSIEWSAV